MPKQQKVSMSLGATINMGNYQSLKVSIGAEINVLPGNTKSNALDTLQEWLIDDLAMRVEEVKERVLEGDILI